MKVVERIFEHKIRQQINTDDMQVSVGEHFFWYQLTWVVPDKIQTAIK